jgi:DNA-binding SARP family transcriptional activator/outer membrane protein assembly factor BamB
MEIRILGPLEAHEDGRELVLPKGRARMLLALLLLHRGQVVSTDRILHALWGEQPPPTAGKAVQGYVSGLRRSLNSGGPANGRLVTRPPGYLLQVAADELDAARFELLAAEGRRALEDGEPAEALASLEGGLELWRGAALAEFAFEEFAQGEIQRLEELRLEALEDRVDALLRLGRGAELVGELEALVAEHLLRERCRGLLMLALYRAGRQADALRVYAEGRRLLKLELGLDPGRELQDLERGILAQDPALDAPPRAARPGGPEPEGPEPDGPQRPRRRWLVAAVAVAALVAAAAIAVAVVARSSGDSAGIPPPAHGVVALDSGSGEVVASTELGSRPMAVAAAGDAVWVGDVLDGVVTRLDARSGEVVKSIGIGAPAIDVAVGRDAVWVATGSSGTIVRVDPEVGAAVDRIELAAPDDVVVPDAASVAVADDGRLWVASAEGVLRVEPRSERVERVDLGATRAEALDVADGAVWATVLDGRTVRIEAGPAALTADFPGPRSGPVVAGEGGVWVGSGRSIYSLEPATATLRGAVEAGGFVADLALDGKTIWAVVYDQQALLRIDTDSLEVEQAIPLGAYPLAVAADGGRVWVCVVTKDPFA